MSTIKTLYGTVNQPITMTLNIANATQRESTAISNATNLYLDVLVTVLIKTASASTSATGYVGVYAYGSTDGSTYDDGIAGTDGTYSPTMTPFNLALIGVITANANSKTTQRTFSIASAFGGQVPTSWGLVIDNESGATFANGTGATGNAWFQGIQAQTV